MTEYALLVINILHYKETLKVMLCVIPVLETY